MEIFDIVDEKGIPTGETIERTQAHEKGVRHRTAHIWIVREQDGKAQLLLQKRSAEKDSFPGRFDTSSAGHIQAGDEPEESAIRELHEELGIRAAKEDLIFAGCFDIQYEKEFYGKMFRDNEVAFVYMYTKHVDAKSLPCKKRKWSAWSGSIWRNSILHCNRQETKGSAFPWRAFGLLNDGGRAEDRDCRNRK